MVIYLRVVTRTLLPTVPHKDHGYTVFQSHVTLCRTSTTHCFTPSSNSHSRHPLFHTHRKHSLNNSFTICFAYGFAQSVHGKQFGEWIACMDGSRVAQLLLEHESDFLVFKF